MCTPTCQRAIGSSAAIPLPCWKFALHRALPQPRTAKSTSHSKSIAVFQVLLPAICWRPLSSCRSDSATKPWASGAKWRSVDEPTVEPDEREASTNVPHFVHSDSFRHLPSARRWHLPFHSRLEAVGDLHAQLRTRLQIHSWLNVTGDLSHSEIDGQLVFRCREQADGIRHGSGNAQVGET